MRDLEYNRYCIRAPHQFIMADNSWLNRQRYEFVDNPPDDTICPVCLDVVEDPHLVECCGHHYCRKCVVRLQTCPVCRAEGIRAIRDRYFERSHLNVLQVRCCERAHGCSWTGQLSELKNHLPECQWTEVGCPYLCGDLIQRRLLQEHTRNCPKRPYTCEYCQHGATFVEITEQHWPVCAKYPVACPNACSAVMVERMALPNHLETCPERKVQCEFSHVGCQWEGARKDMDGHLEERWRSHTTLLSNHYLLELQSQQKEIHSLQQKFKQQEERLTATVTQTQLQSQQKEIDSLQQKLKQQEVRLTTVTQLQTSLSEKVDELCLAQEQEGSTDEDDLVAGACAFTYPPLPSSPFRFQIDRVVHKKLNNNSHHSPAFYLMNPRYRMQITVYLGGYGDGKGSHVSVYARILRGDYDDQLKWPFRGYITVCLCSYRQHFSDHEKDIVYDNTVDSSCSGRVFGQQVSEGFGFDQFIPHSELWIYTHEDTLTFELPQVPA